MILLVGFMIFFPSTVRQGLLRHNRECVNILEFDIPFHVTSYMQEPVREVVERVHPIIREELEGSLNHQKELNRVHSITREKLFKRVHSIIRKTKRVHSIIREELEGSLDHQIGTHEDSLDHQRETLGFT